MGMEEIHKRYSHLIFLICFGGNVYEKIKIDANIFKLIIAFILAIMLFCFVLLEGLTASAYTIANTGLDVSVNNDVWDKVNIHLIENKNEYHERIVSFDVSDNGYVVLATKDRKILVLDDYGRLLKTFSFVSAGDYYVQWNNENIILYTVRGLNVIEFSMESECISVSKLNTSNANETWKRFDKLKTIVVDDNTYEVKREMGVISNILFSGEYTKLLKTDSDGNTTILYEVAQNDIRNTKFIVSAVLVLAVAIIITIIVAIYKSVKGIKDRTR